MLRSWSRGNYFRVGRENRINNEWDLIKFDLTVSEVIRGEEAKSAFYD